MAEESSTSRGKRARKNGSVDDAFETLIARLERATNATDELLVRLTKSIGQRDKKHLLIARLERVVVHLESDADARPTNAKGGTK